MTRDGPVAEPGQGAPPLPRHLHLAGGEALTVELRAGQFRLYAGRADGPLIAGKDLGLQNHLLAVPRDGAALAAPVLPLAMLAGAFTIGLRSLSPVESPIAAR